MLHSTADPHDLGAKLHLVGSNRGRIAGRRKVEHLSLEQTALNLRLFIEVLDPIRGRQLSVAYGSAKALLEFFFIHYGSE